MEPVPAPLPVVYVDDWLAVVDKPAGLMVHDSALARGETDFAADRLREQFGRPIFLVHRLDRATSGCLLLLLLFVCGWTGYVMVWDTFGQHLARQGARMIDSLPVLSEPTGRTFTGEQPVPTVFFFLNLFAHIGIPLAMGAAFWLHVKRLQRPLMLPPPGESSPSVKSRKTEPGSRRN